VESTLNQLNTIAPTLLRSLSGAGGSRNTGTRRLTNGGETTNDATGSDGLEFSSDVQ
jgi:hypothetical protein